MDKRFKLRTIDYMTPIEIAECSLFMAKEAGLQKILQSAGSATGLDPQRLQDALLGAAGTGVLGAGVGAMAGGGKGAALGGLLGGAGGAAGGYAGSPYVREMLEKLLGGGVQEDPFGSGESPENVTTGPNQFTNVPPTPDVFNTTTGPDQFTGVPPTPAGFGAPGSTEMPELVSAQ